LSSIMFPGTTAGRRCREIRRIVGLVRLGLRWHPAGGPVVKREQACEQVGACCGQDVTAIVASDDRSLVEFAKPVGQYAGPDRAAAFLQLAECRRRLVL